MSTKMGLKPFCMTELTSETHVRLGKTISFLLYKIFRIEMVIRFADDPEFTNTLYLIPNHLDHFFSNSLTCFD